MPFNVIASLARMKAAITGTLGAVSKVSGTTPSSDVPFVIVSSPKLTPR
jgi:hypothetical protein